MTNAIKIQRFFELAFNNNYEIKFRFNNVFNSADIQNLFKNKERIKGRAYASGIRDSAPKKPVLPIFVSGSEYNSPTFAKSTELMYNESTYFFRIYTQDDVEDVRNRFILGIHQPETLRMSNIKVYENKLKPTFSLEGYTTLTGNLKIAGYLTTKRESRPYDNINIEIGIGDNGKE